MKPVTKPVYRLVTLCCCTILIASCTSHKTVVLRSHRMEYAQVLHSEKQMPYQPDTLHLVLCKDEMTHLPLQKELMPKPNTFTAQYKQPFNKHFHRAHHLHHSFKTNPIQGIRHALAPSSAKSISPSRDVNYGGLWIGLLLGAAALAGIALVTTSSVFVLAVLLFCSFFMLIASYVYFVCWMLKLVSKDE